MSAAKNRRNMILALILVAVIAVAATYGAITLMLPQPTSQYTFVTCGVKPTLDVGYLPSQLGWEVAKKDYNIVIENQVFTDSNIGLAALERGDIDVYAEMPNVALKAKLSGIDLTCIFTRMEQMDVYMVVSNTSTVKNIPDDLVGKTVVVGGIGSGSSWAAMQYLYAKYPQLNGTTQMFVIKGAENRAAAIIRGQIEITWVEASDLAGLAEFGIKPVLSFMDLCPNMIQMCWYVKTDYMNKNPELVQKLVTSLMKGYRNLYDTDDMITVGMKTLQSIVPESDLRTAMEYYRQIKWCPVNVSPTQAEWKQALDYYVLTGAITRAEADTFTYSQAVDIHFAENAQNQLGTYQFK